MPVRESKRESFEQLYAQLEASVNKLEQGGLSLDQAIALYEEGMTLARRCQERLDEAELKITKLKDAFATAPERPSASAVDASPEDYEYVDEEALATVEEDEFE